MMKIFFVKLETKAKPVINRIITEIRVNYSKSCLFCANHSSTYTQTYALIRKIFRKLQTSENRKNLEVFYHSTVNFLSNLKY